MKSATTWLSDGSLGPHWMDVDMVNGASSASGYVIVPLPSQSVKTARYFRITFPERGKILLKIGPGDHSVQEWELDRDQLRSLVLDAMPELLKESK